MKPSPSVSSSDLERARATAGRLVSTTPGEAPTAALEKPEEYVRFSAGALGITPGTPPSRPTPALPRPTPPPPAPRVAPAPAPRVAPAPVAPDVTSAPPAPPPPKPERTPRVVPSPPPPPPPRAAAPPEPAPPPPEPEPPEPAGEAVFEIEETPDLGEPTEAEQLGVIDDDEPVAAPPDPPAAPVSEGLLEFDEDIAGIAAAAVADLEEPAVAEPAPTWAEILDDAIYLAHARCALVMDGAGQVRESRGDWPKNTIDKVANRLLRGIEQAPATDPDASQIIEIQLGSFWLTGLRVTLGGNPAIVGFLSPAPVKREVRPGIEAEARRGTPL